MPRDANGNYTLPSGNPVVTQTDISSVWANDTMSDLGNELTDSLSRSGKGGMTGPFPIIDKQGNVPGLSFAAEPTSGLEREAAGDVRLQVQGTDKMRWTAAGDAEVWRNSAWNLVAIEPASGKFMLGEGGVTTLFHYGTTAAPGWTIEAPDGNVRSLMIGPSAQGGQIGGTQDPTSLSDSVNISISISGTTSGKSLSLNQLPSWNIDIPVYGTDSGSSNQVRAGAGGQAGTASIATGGAGNVHTHTFSGSDSGSDSVSFTPRYARGILMKLDA